MCRMLFAAGKLDMESLVNGLCFMAGDRNEDHENNKGKKGKFTHYDGWGAAWSTGDKFEFIRSAEPCCSDQNIDKVLGLETNAVLLHARRASQGEVCLANAHPFVKEIAGRKLIFAHNGTIGNDLELYGNEPFGTTDSERYFINLAVPFLKNGLTGLVKAFNDVWDYTGANFIMIDGSKVYVGTKCLVNPLYYKMKVGQGNGMIIVSSEEIPLKGVEWEPCLKRDLMIIDIDNLEISRVSAEHIKNV